MGASSAVAEKRSIRSPFEMFVTVVMSLALLLVAWEILTPQWIGGSGLIADRLGTKKNMEAIWRWHQIAANRNGGALPGRVGHQFVLMPWIEGICPRTQRSFARFWVEGVSEPRRQELDNLGQLDGWETVWTSYDEVSSEDTHFAGPSRAHLETLTLHDETQPMLATDNEFAPLLRDGTVLVLMNDGSFIELGPDTLLEHYGYDIAQNRDEGFYVGPDSPEPLLQTLEF